MNIYYRLNIAGEKEPLFTSTDKYHGITIGANIAAWGKNWIPIFINDLNKPFFIDPMTYVFALELDMIKGEENIKKSFRELIDCYGDRLKSIINENRPININDFVKNDSFNDEFLEEFVDCNLKFQRDLMKGMTSSQKSIAEYLEVLDEKPIEIINAPEFLVSPYFFCNSRKDPWYEISKELAIRTLQKSEKKEDVYCVICISMDMLQNLEDIEAILNDYADFDGYLIWVSGFYENFVGSQYLIGFIDFINRLSGYEKPIINLYGGFFSLIMSKFGLSGSSSGICYSEGKDVSTKTTGGGFEKRYYIPHAKFKAVEADARTYYLDNFEKEEIFCNCQICSNLRNSIQTTEDKSEIIDQFFTKISRVQANSHYIENKKKDLDEIKEMAIAEIIGKINIISEVCETTNCGLYKIKYEHLTKWIEALKGRS